MLVFGNGILENSGPLQDPQDSSRILLLLVVPGHTIRELDGSPSKNVQGTTNR